MKTFLGLLVFTLLSTILNAQDSHISYYYGPAEVSSMAADGDRLWIGSNTGLFNVNINSGKTETFQTVNSGIQSNKIATIAIDRKGAKWIGHPDGISVYDGSAWKNYKVSDFIQANSYFNNISSIAFGKDNTAWIGTYKGLVRFDGNNWTLFRPTNTEDSYFSVNAIIVDNSDIKWLATSRGLEMFDGSSWTIIDTTKGGIKTDGIHCLAIDSKGSKWFSTGAMVLYKYDGEKMVSYKIPTADSAGYYTYVNSVSIDKNDIVWIGSDKLLSFDGGSWKSYNQKDHKLPGNYVNSVISDNSGNIWAGTDKNAARLNGSSFTTFDLSNSGLPDNHVRSILSDMEGNTWVISAGYLSVIKNGIWYNFNKKNSGLPSDYVTSLAFDRFNNKWIGTSNGLVKYDGNRTWTVYNSQNSGLLDNFVSALAFDSKGVLWIAANEGLAKFDGHNWKFYNRFNSGFSGQPFSLAVDLEDIKWIGLGTGLLKFEGNSWELYDKGWTPSIVIDKDNTKWFSSSRLTDNKNWTYYNASSMVYSVIPISRDSVLLASETGLAGVNLSSGSLQWHPLNDKLLDKALRTIFLDSNSNLWVGSEYGGIAVYNEKGLASASSGFLLNQNYPNPFNSSTTIYYNVPSAGATVLKVYDILGREVTTLVDEFKAPGTYKVNFYAGSLAGGVYVYSVTSGGRRESRKLVLLK